jgi:glycerol kinase
VAPTAETTALGAAMLAAHGAGVAMQPPEAVKDDGGRVFRPSQGSADAHAALIARWRAALGATLHHAGHR